MKTHLNREPVCVVGRIFAALLLVATLPNQAVAQDATPQTGHITVLPVVPQQDAFRPDDLGHPINLAASTADASSLVQGGMVQLKTEVCNDNVQLTGRGEEFVQ